MADNTYQVEYSSTDRATCKDTKCKQKISKGVLRIGKEAASPFGDDTMLNWYHASCAFRALTRAKGSTKKIDDMDDLRGHEDISSADKKYLTRLINGETLWSETGWKPPSSTKSAAVKETATKKRKVTETAKPAKKAKGGSSGKKTYLEFFGSKFWEIEVDGSAINIRFGKVGCAGASQTKSWGSHAAALAQAEKQIRAKKRAGYKEEDEGSSDDDKEDDDDEEEEEESESSESSSEEEEEEEEDDWQWQDEDNKWHSYAPVQQKGIKAAIKAGRLFYKFDLGSNSYRIHLKMLYQLNTATSVKRKVRVK